MFPRQPSKPEIVLQSILVFYLAIIAHGYISGLSAADCPAPDCYAWGTEKLMALGWEYESREIYLRAAFLRLLFGVVAVAAPFIAPSAWISFPVVIAVFVGEYAFHRDWAVGGGFPTPH